MSTTWGSLVEIGAWVSYDNQIVKSLATAMYALAECNKQTI